jgi:alkanesulfonate monooxygenase SsuD/methylene tetrahydromethanopterin reductase-like flavin-dependent oxidoreductase (luciferase family)
MKTARANRASDEKGALMMSANNTAGAATWTTHPWVTAGNGTLRFGVGADPSRDWSAFLDSARFAEELGFDSYWLSDHPLWFPDCWTSMMALAMATKTMRLGTIVSCIYYRSPALLARMAADVDAVSDGRLILGLGIGDHAEEFKQLGLPYPPVRERQETLEETIQVVRGLWTEEPLTYHGTYVHLTGATGAPGPVQQPSVPLLIGGGGERVTLRQVAQYADVANFGGHIWMGSAFTVDDVARKYEALRRHCEALNRPYESILRSYVDMPLILAETPAAVQAKLATIPPDLAEFFRSSTVAVTPREAIAHYRALAAAGVQYFIATLWGYDTETMRLLAEQVVPEVIATSVPS